MSYHSLAVNVPLRRYWVIRGEATRIHSERAQRWVEWYEKGGGRTGWPDAAGSEREAEDMSGWGVREGEPCASGREAVRIREPETLQRPEGTRGPVAQPVRALC